LIEILHFGRCLIKERRNPNLIQADQSTTESRFIESVAMQAPVPTFFSGFVAAENIVQMLVVMLIGIGMGYILRGPVLFDSNNSSDGGLKKFGTSLSSSSTSEELPPKPEKVPRHVAVIMDGNRRFGRMQHSDPLKGHWAGGQTLVDFVQWCMNDGIEVLTVYAFSTENWARDPVEVQTLMTIFAKYAESFKHEALSRNVRVRVISTDFDRLPPNVIAAVHVSVEVGMTVRCVCW
jgi:hypothetical protein